MGTIATLDQILATIRQLPETQRNRLLKQLNALPKSEQARLTARRLRGKYRVSPHQRQRMSELLSKGNDGKLTASEKDELHDLVADFEKKTLELAQAIAETFGHSFLNGQVK